MHNENVTNKPRSPVKIKCKKHTKVTWGRVSYINIYTNGIYRVQIIRVKYNSQGDIEINCHLV